MSVYDRKTVSDFFYEKVDAILIVDAKSNIFTTVKKTGFFEKVLEDKGSYHDLVEKLWFHLKDSDKKITDDYHVFVPMVGKFAGKYADRVTLNYEDKIHLVQIAIYPLDEDKTKYMLMLDELDNSEYIRDFLTDKKVSTIQNTYLFSMYVDLIKNTTNSISVTEISDNSMNYTVSYTDWRMMIVNMIWPDDQSLFLERTDPEYLKKNLLPGRTSSFDCQMKNLEGVFIWVKLVFSRTVTKNDTDFKFVFMVQNIHEDSLKLFDTLKKYEDLASKDALTGVFNHGRIETEITNAVEAVKSKGQKVSLMMLDIDFFKKVNDRLGHSVGDRVLKHFVNLANEFIKGRDIKMGRWGGEEFICVCYGIDLEQLGDFAEELRKKISESSFEQVENLTCSIGLTQLQENDTAELAFDRVDRAMYMAKSSGRNNVKTN